MPPPKPEPGLVIAYDYLWRYEKRRGQESGVKTRPCAIVLAVKNEAGEDVVMVVPITHRRPDDSDTAIALPARVKRHLDLDDQASWIIADEVNRFVWPGPDLRPISFRHTDKFDHGFLPIDIFDQLRRRIVALHRARRLRIITRSE